MKYEFHPEAEVSELGFRFADEVERVIRLVLEHPELGSPLDEELRHFVLRRFPFSVVYAFVSDVVYVVAVAREPGYWRPRVQDR
jgi:siroheme synthase